MSIITYENAFLENVKDCKQYDTKFIMDDWPKLQQAAEVHNYRGPSKKKHNGIVPIRPSDKGLLKTLAKLSKEYKWNIKIGQIPIKVVAHCPSGNRLVGYRYYDENKYCIHILGLANYAD
jgi:hypothetical protein